MNKYFKDGDIIVMNCSTIPGFVWPEECSKSESNVRKIKGNSDSKVYQFLVKDVCLATKKWKQVPELNILSEWENEDLTLIINNFGIRKEGDLPDESTTYRGTSINLEGRKSLVDFTDIFNFIAPFFNEIDFHFIWNSFKLTKQKHSIIKKILPDKSIELVR